MPDKAISNTSPLLYLHRCGGLAWPPRLFTLVYVPGAVAFELAEGRNRGFDEPVGSAAEGVVTVWSYPTALFGSSGSILVSKRGTSLVAVFQTSSQSTAS